jgi:hypothetical protein
MAEKKVINIEDFFTVDNEKNGIWFEPKINGNPCGIEFLVTGRGTDENIAGTERFEKAISETEDIKDPLERIKKQKELDANRVAEFVKGIRCSEGNDVLYGGKPLEYSVPLIQQILLKSPLIKDAIVEFARDTTNFIKREKNV